MSGLCVVFGDAVAVLGVYGVLVGFMLYALHQCCVVVAHSLVNLSAAPKS